MKYVVLDPDTGSIVQHDVNYGDLRRMFPNTSFPASPPAGDLPHLNVYRVQQAARPATNTTQTARRIEPAKVGGRWTEQWEVVQMSGAEVVAMRAAARAKKASEVEVKLEAALLKRTLQWARNQFPAIVTRAQEKIDAINAAEDPDSVDTEDIQ